MSKRLLYSVLLYLVGAFLDTVTTCYNVFVSGEYYEANPFNKYFIYNYPPWIWFARDCLFLVVILLTTIGLCWSLKIIAKKTKMYKIPMYAEKYSWIIVFIPAIIKLTAFIHNMLLWYGIETPIISIYSLFYK